MNLLFLNSLLAQIGNSARFCHKEIVSDCIGQEAIDLFRHGAVTASQSCLNVCNGNPQLDTDEAASNGGIHIAHHNHQIGMDLFEYFLKLHHDLGGLLSMRS